ncbi:ArnT family glycosyltransferase [Actinopolymorpha pittospori]|uniref:4-amino-4-deoxy-L-arabinose transferase-like glycosyltransferase n=1 Tax=Actinopolymorpha pittospori TaxID=648752 RepID=A0A927MR15_9ACTN|nr:glycosyltransferase family 39 protein [Actinopolymorpha pittospori]MBE1605094.1 4-amino-4-deoxy-L-arabinose transferase-like glycosyltransferase [Actinopolymorpha pittospori]
MLRERSVIWTERATLRARIVPTWAFVLVVLGLTTAVWAALQSSAPYLGHDEAVYATKARSWLTDIPASQWGLHRAPGLPVLGYVALTFHDGELAVRLVGLALALAAFGLFFWTAARLLGPRRGFVVALLVLSAPGVMRRVPEYLSDVGAAGMLAGMAYCLVRAQERSRGHHLVGAAAFALAAFYLRYGAVAGMLALVLAALLVWGPRPWLARGRDVAGAIVVLFVGLVPHLVEAERLTGSVFGLVRAAGEAGNPVFFGDGLRYYLSILPIMIAGPWGGVVMAAGVVGAVLAGWRLLRARTSRTRGGGGGRQVTAARPEDRRTVFVVLAAVALVVMLGLTAHGEPRFVFLSVFLLLLAGVQTLSTWAGRRSAVLLGALAVVAVATMPVSARLLIDNQLIPVSRERASVALAAAAVRSSESAGPSAPCVVVAQAPPEAGWYSRCATANLRQARAGDLPPGPVSYLLFEHGQGQPTEAMVRKLARGRPVRTTDLPAAGTLGRARILTVG